MPFQINFGDKLKSLNHLKYTSISTRISILLGIIIILTMGAFTIFSLVKQKEDAIVNICNNTQQLSQAIEKILRVSMLKNRRDEISIAVNNIVDSEGIKSVRILNHLGEIKFSSKHFEINKNVSENSRLCVSCHKQKDKNSFNSKNFVNYRIDDKQNLIYNALPIYNAPNCYNGACHSTAQTTSDKQNEFSNNDSDITPHDSAQTILGFIEIEVSIKRIISNIEKTRTQLLTLTAVLALLASVLTYFSIKYLIGKPVKNLVEGTQRVAQGDFQHEIPPGKAELGILSDSFNKMQKQLLTTQTQLIESEKLASVGKLSEEIANEINNPLTGIIIYSENLLDEAGENSPEKNDLNTIRREALKIRESVRNVLSLTRHEKPDFAPVDIEEIIKHAVSIVRKFSYFNNIQIITDISKSIPEVSADSGLIEQVFLNLLLTSSESMPTGGILNISVVFDNENNRIDIEFTDTGKEMPKEVIKQIYDRLHTSGNASYEKIVRSLTVCKDIIDMHRGDMSIKSAASGTTITIKMPV